MKTNLKVSPNVKGIQTAVKRTENTAPTVLLQLRGCSEGNYPIGIAGTTVCQRGEELGAALGWARAASPNLGTMGMSQTSSLGRTGQGAGSNRVLGAGGAEQELQERGRQPVPPDTMNAVPPDAHIYT